MSEKIEIGDKVRACIEDEVEYVDMLGRVTVRGVTFIPYALGVSVEIIERRNPRVGDVISSEDAYDALPSGSLVRFSMESSHAHPGLARLSNGSWVDLIDGRTYASERMGITPRKIVYIP